MRHRLTAPRLVLVAAVTIIAGCSVAPESAIRSTPAATPTAIRTPEPSILPTTQAAPIASEDACPSIPTEPPPMPDLARDVDEATRTAIRMRIEYGLRHDLFWVEHVAAQPDITMSWGFPMLPSEETLLFSRNPGTEVVQAAIARYGHAEEFGGIWIDQSIGGVVVLAWKGDLGRHEAGIRAQLPDCHPVLFRQVRWGLAELNRWRDRIFADHDWFAEIPAAPQGFGVSEMDNAVVVSISSANADAESMMTQHYGAPPGLIHVESDGTGAELLPSQKVTGRVLTADGNAPGDMGLQAQSGDNGVPGSCPTEPFGGHVNADGTFELHCKVGRRLIEIVVFGDPLEDHGTLASTEVLVREGQALHVELRLAEDFEPAPPP